MQPKYERSEGQPRQRQSELKAAGGCSL